MIEEIINSKFQVINKDTLREQTSMPLGYESDQYVVKLSNNYSGERYDPIKTLRCEIQVRTVAMHAWATVSHHLDYKKDVDIPSELKGDFYALSGVFHIADSLFEQFRKAREVAIKELMDFVNTKQDFNLSREMNVDSLKAYLNWKFPKRNVYTISGFSELLSEIKSNGIESFRSLDDLLNKNCKWFLEYEKKYPPKYKVILKNSKLSMEEIVNIEDRIYANIGVVRKILGKKKGRQKKAPKK